MPVPGRAAARLGGFKTPARAGIRSVAAADLHLTLHFLGQRDPGPVRAALRSVASPSFEIRLAEPGRFPLGRGKRVLWIGVEPTPGLMRLHVATGAALAATGFEVESRPYRPHITIARAGPGTSRRLLAEIEKALAPAAGSAFTASRFALFASETAPEGARYRILESFSLTS